MSVHTTLRRAYRKTKCAYPRGRVQRDTITYNSALGACEKGEHWQQTLGSFESMRGEYVQRNTITYSATIKACEKGGHLQQALELCERLV